MNNTVRCESGKRECKTGLPSSGTASDVAGRLALTMVWKTLSASSIVMSENQQTLHKLIDYSRNWALQSVKLKTVFPCIFLRMSN